MHVSNMGSQDSDSGNNGNVLLNCFICTDFNVSDTILYTRSQVKKNTVNLFGVKRTVPRKSV
jgi:hypothetical protein